MGIRISLDDFGTGYSSLSYLKNFPIDVIKIDRSFVMDLSNSEQDRSIVDAIISMSKALNLKIIAEGVETLSNAKFLEEKQCDQAQGYYFSRPLSAVELEEILKSGKKHLPI